MPGTQQQRKQRYSRLSDLTPHPLNTSIYGDNGEDLTLSVREHGVLEPLIITTAGVIVSGHRRYHAALAVGLDAVLVEVREYPDDLAIVEALVHHNRQRIKTNEQLGREVVALEDVARERAKQRQVANLKKGTTAPVREPVPERENGSRWRADVGRQVGVSGKQAEMLADATKAATAAEDDGQPEEAKRIRSILNRSAKKAQAYAREKNLIPGKTPPPTPNRNYVTLAEWNALTVEQQSDLLNLPPSQGQGRGGMNQQKTSDIEWAKWSWNPVTGCLHNCPYCYARDIANRVYEQKFIPALIPERLSGPARQKVPSIAEGDVSYRNIFTCSMADLFGRWVPQEWIEAVLEVVRGNPQWNFLFLTKFPNRLAEFTYPPNAWIGTTVDCQARVQNAERAFASVSATVKWLSLEPLLEPLEFTSLDTFDWIVLGGSSESENTPEWRPPREWVDDLEREARRHGLKVYEKTNLLDRAREYPGVHTPTRLLPNELKYLPGLVKT